MDTLFVITIIAGSVCLIFVAVQSSKQKRAKRIELLTKVLAPEDPRVLIDDKGHASCTFRGFPMRFRFGTRGAGSSSVPWTEVEVDVPHAPLTLSIRPQKERDAHLVREGLAVDVELGNPLLDARYLIEGAPATIVTRVFTREVQAKMLACAPDEVDTVSFGIVVARRGWREVQSDVQALVDLAVSVAENIAPAIADTAVPTPESAYRGGAVSAADAEKWQSARRAREAEQLAEVQALERTRENRRKYERGRTIAIFAVIAALFLAAWIMKAIR